MSCVPFLFPDETLESNPMKMAGDDGKPEQVDPATPGQSLSLQFNHDFAVIIILAGPRIVTQQVTATNHAIDHTDNCNFIKVKTLPLEPSSPSLRFKSKQIKTCDQNKFEQNRNAISSQLSVPTVLHRRKERR